MLVDWKYVYKRRSWSSTLIVNSLKDKTWENFEIYFKEKQIECPPKEEFEKAMAQIKERKSSSIKSKPKIKRKKRTPTKITKPKTPRGKRKK